jgi:hypothetical protein
MIESLQDPVLEVSVIKLSYSVRNSTRGLQPGPESVRLSMAEAAIAKHPDVKNVVFTGKIADHRVSFEIQLTGTKSIDDANVLAAKLQALVDHCLKIEL